jgi:ribose transport system substrate-binding protein
LRLSCVSRDEVELQMRRLPVNPVWPLLLLAILTTGCHKEEDRLPTIAIIPKTTATNVWKAMHVAVLEEAAHCHCKIEWNAPESEADYTQQASMVEDAIRRRVSGIILAPAHQLVLASSVKMAREAGIPVIIVDSPIALPANEYAAYIGSSDQEIGFMAADQIGMLLHHKGKVGIIGVSPTLEGSNTKEDAFVHEINDHYPEITVVDVGYGLSDWARSSQAAEDMITKHKDLDAIFASDGFATSGTAHVLQVHKTNRKIRLVGVDQEGDVLKAVRQGSVDSVIVKDSYAIGKLAMSEMTAILQHHPQPNTVVIPVYLVTRKNIDSDQIQHLLPRHHGAMAPHLP